MNRILCTLLLYLLLFFMLSIISINIYADCKDNGSKYVISTDGEVIILLSEEKSCAIIIDSKGERVITFKDIEQVHDIEPNMQASLSFNSKFVLIEFNASDSEHIIKVIALDNLQVKLEKKATFAIWMKKNNRLILVPEYGLEDLQKTSGLIIYKPEENEMQRVAREYYFTGNVITGGNKIIARILEYDNKQPVFRTIIYDLDMKVEIELNN